MGVSAVQTHEVGPVEVNRGCRRSADSCVTSDHDKFIKVSTQEIHQLHSTWSSLAVDMAVPLMILGIILGAILAIWIFRRGLSRCATSTLTISEALDRSED